MNHFMSNINSFTIVFSITMGVVGNPKWMVGNLKVTHIFVLRGYAVTHMLL